MANSFGNYIPQLYANEALPHLMNSLGFAGTVLKPYNDERAAFRKADTISIRRPSRFSVSDAPATAEDLTAEDVSITLDYWRETKWKATDRELTNTDPRVVSEHVRPQAYALASDVNAKLHTLYSTGVGTQIDSGTANSIVGDDMVDVRKRMQDNGVPMNDGRLNLVIDPTREAGLLKDNDFNLHSGAGTVGVETQTSGFLARKFGFNVIVDQQAGLNTYTAGTASISTGDNLGAVNLAAGYKTGLKSIVVDTFTGSETIKAGDEVTFAGHNAHYTVASDVTLSTGAGTIVLAEGLIESVADDEVVTLNGSETTHTQPMIAYHPDAFALVTAPMAMTEELRGMGVNVGVATDQSTGISVRTRMYAVPNSSEIHMAMDILFGIKVLNSMYAAKIVV